jgi:hypothetical protein
MTERTPLRGRRARWSAAFVVAPTAAAVFAATTAWSAAHDPTPASASSGSSSGGGGSDVTSLQQTLDDQAARVAALQAQLAQLRAEAASLGHAIGTPVNPLPAGATRTTTRPPAVHAVTGGS